MYRYFHQYKGVIIWIALYTGVYFITPIIWPLQVLSVLPPFLFALLPAIFVGRYIVRKDLLGISVSLCLLAMSFLFWEVRPFAFLDTSGVTSSGTTIFSSNMPLWYHKEYMQEYGAFLQQQKAQVYHLQEMVPPGSSTQPPVAYFQKLFPGYTVIAHHELVTITSLPVVEWEYHDGADFQRVRVLLNNKEVDLFNVHIGIHLIPHLLRYPGNFFRDMSLRYEDRKKNFLALEKAVSVSTHAFISGDFNTSKMMGMMRPLEAMTTDSFSVSGIFFPRTWDEQQYLFWRIDYALAKALDFISHETVLQGDFSDHAALKVVLE